MNKNNRCHRSHLGTKIRQYAGNRPQIHLDTQKWREISRDVDDYVAWRPRCKNVIIETQCNLKKPVSLFRHHYGCWCLSTVRCCDICKQSDDQHHSDVIMSTMVSQTTSLTIVYSTIYSGADQRNRVPRHWPLCGEFTGHRWIPRTKGQ